MVSEQEKSMPNQSSATLTSVQSPSTFMAPCRKTHRLGVLRSSSVCGAPVHGSTRWRETTGGLDASETGRKPSTSRVSDTRASTTSKSLT